MRHCCVTVSLIFCFICKYSYQNKKQRMMVRAAVLKMKDPRQIIRDMEKLDEMGKDPLVWLTTKEHF